MARIANTGFFPSETWGPRPSWALLPSLAAMAVAVLVSRAEAPGGTSARVTALKPVADGDDPGLLAGGMPIEVAYGVPSARTIRLWTRP